MEIVDMKFLYVEFESFVYYNPNKASSSSAVKSIILDSVNKYAKSSDMNGVGSRFKFSKFQKIIAACRNYELDSCVLVSRPV